MTLWHVWAVGVGDWPPDRLSDTPDAVLEATGVEVIANALIRGQIKLPARSSLEVGIFVRLADRSEPAIELCRYWPQEQLRKGRKDG